MNRFSLAQQMVELADHLQARPDHPLRRDAAALEAALAKLPKFPDQFDARRLTPTWMQAWRTWCQYGGQP